MFDQTPGPGRRGADRVELMAEIESRVLDVQLSQLERCFGGAIPAVIATASADGTPNITYLSRVHRVDDERVALSNQFFSKTVQNLAENPRASVLLMDPVTYDQYRLTIAYERTERRGPVFERLRARRRRPRRPRRDDGGVQAPRRRHLPGARHRAGALGAAAARGLPATGGRRRHGRPERAGGAGVAAGAGRRPRHARVRDGAGPRRPVRLRALGAPAARRGRHAPVHHRQPRLRRAGRGVGGRRRRGAGRAWPRPAARRCASGTCTR